jgi:hypothetical protein
MATQTAAGLAWQDARTAGGDELRATSAAELAGMLADALQVVEGGDAHGYTPAWQREARQAAARITYYLDVARYGEAAAAAIEAALDATLAGG